VGVVGYTHGGRGLTGGSARDVPRAYGRFGGLHRVAFPASLERRPKSTESAMDKIAGDPGRRGPGIGSRLLDEVAAGSVTVKLQAAYSAAVTGTDERYAHWPHPRAPVTTGRTGRNECATRPQWAKLPILGLLFGYLYKCPACPLLWEMTMRIRTSLIAVAGAALFAFAGAGTAHAGGHGGHDDGLVVGHRTSSGVKFSDDGDRHRGDGFAVWHVTESFVVIH
jgi:hypothetical protein